MNEITRIHLAKIPYDMEVSAKKQLETYLRTLEVHTEDADWLQDIEIRITEILEERGIQRDGLVTVADIAAIRAQLGEPEDFFGEGDIATGAEKIEQAEGPRRLYRDPSTAMLGGVLSGIARYLKIDSVWVRLAFIVLLFVSFGTAAIVYLVLWIVLPPATTAAAQLELSGEPVTIASLKDQRTKMDKVGQVSRGAQIARSVLLYGTGTVATVMAIGSLIATLWVAGALAFGGPEASPMLAMLSNSFSLWFALSLFVLSGLLLSALFTLVAVVCFSRKFTKAIGISFIAIVVVGIVAFGSGVATVTYSEWQRNEQLSASRQTKTVVLPAEFSQVKALTIGAVEKDQAWYGSVLQSAGIEYIVSDGSPRYELTVDSETAKLKPVIEVKDDTAVVSFKNAPEARAGFGYIQHPILKIYGPALEQFNSEVGSVSYTNTKTQEMLGATADKGQIEVIGSFKVLSAEVKNGGQISLDNASIDTLKAGMGQGALTAGVVKALEVTQPESCPAHDDVSERDTIQVQAVTSGVMIINGVEKPAKTLTGTCGVVQIGNDDEYDTIEG